jgi:hypothetical protein
MAEQTFEQSGGNRASKGSKTGSKSTQGIGEQAANAGREFKEKATDLAETAGEKVKEGASQLADAARDAASQAADRIKDTVSEQKGAGAAYVGNLAEVMRRASREFDDELPIAGKYIRKAASQVENVADSIRTGDFNDLLSSAKSFARRQPAAFLGLATLAGFAAVRFLKSSRDDSQTSHHPSSKQGPRSPADYHGYQEARSPAEFRANPRPSGADYVG